MKPRHYALLAVLLMLLAGFVALVRQITADADHRAPPISTPALPPPAALSAPPPPAPPPSAVPATSSAHPADPEWISGMRAERSPRGQLLRLRADPSLSARNRAAPGFRVEDPEQAVARARELLRELAPSLGVRAELPLIDARASGDSVSSQVSFHESLGGVPVAPYGTVTLQIGPQGELLNLNSDYLPAIEPANQPRLSADEAKLGSGVASLEGGRPVLWVTQPRADAASTASQAYEFQSHGRQIVVDAESGKVIHEQDKRVN